MSTINNIHNWNSDGIASMQCPNQLQQFVNQATQSNHSSNSLNLNSGHSFVQSYDSSGVSSICDPPIKSSLTTQLCFNIDNQASEIYPLPTMSTEFDAPSTVKSTSSTWQMQPGTENLVASLSPEYSVSFNNQNPHATPANATPTWQTLSDVNNSPFQPKYPSADATWPNSMPTSEVEKKKKRVICCCPNCSVEGGNNTYSKNGRLQHNCHIPGCDKYFDWPSILQVHLRTHMNDRPFTCSWHSCGKKFKSKEELVRHIKTHTGERNFACPRCQVRFTRSDHLDKHIYTIHERPKPKKPTKNRK